MADDGRVYSDEEFAVILRNAVELASKAESAESSAASSAGLTLGEMKAAAAGAGFDPRLVEQAARMLGSSSTASPLERLIGGPLRHQQSAHFPITLDDEGAARLLSVVRITAGLAGRQDVGHSSASGMTWHDGGDTESLGVRARAEEDGTALSVDLDRRGTLALTATASAVTVFFAVLFSGSVLYPEAPALGIAGGLAGIGGAFALARAYWTSSTRKAQERIDGVMDAVANALGQSETRASEVRAVEDGAETG
jgi:hypothetical protein